MDPTSLIASLMAARLGQVQIAVAAKMMKMNADNAQSVVKLVEAAQDNLNQLAATAPGVGTNLDITV